MTATHDQAVCCNCGVPHVAAIQQRHSHHERIQLAGEHGVQIRVRSDAHVWAGTPRRVRELERDAEAAHCDGCAATQGRYAHCGHGEGREAAKGRGGGRHEGYSPSEGAVCIHHGHAQCKWAGVATSTTPGTRTLGERCEEWGIELLRAHPTQVKRRASRLQRHRVTSGRHTARYEHRAGARWFAIRACQRSSRCKRSRREHRLLRIAARGRIVQDGRPLDGARGRRHCGHVRHGGSGCGLCRRAGYTR